MTPDTPGNPSEGKPKEAEKADVEATEAKAAKGKQKGEAEAAKPATAKRTRKKTEPEAAETAAAKTKTDKAAADAVSDKPAKAPTKKKAAAAKDDEGAAEAAEKPAKKAPARKRGAEATKPAPTRARRGGKAGEGAVLVRAQARYVRSSARKARLVSDHIRGKDVAEARAILAYSPRAVSEAWSKLLESAVANAENNHDLVGEELRIAAIYADEGPTIKRFRPRAMGRATKILKRTSHLSIALTPKETVK